MALIVKSRRAMSSSSSIEASLTIAKSRCPGPVERSARGGVSSMPAGASARIGPVTRVEAHADELAVDLHVLDAAVRLEERPQPRLVDAGNEEVLVAVREAEELVPHRAADDVRVDPERADVGADLGRHGDSDGRIGGRRGAAAGQVRLPYTCATASISTSAPDGSLATSNVERAGGRSPT